MSQLTIERERERDKEEKGRLVLLVDDSIQTLVKISITKHDQDEESERFDDNMKRKGKN